MILYIILGVLLFIIAFVFIICFRFTSKIIFPQRDDYETICKDLKERLNYSNEDFDKLINRPYEKINITSSYGYPIYGRLFKNKIKDSNKFVILLHRESRNLIASYKFLNMYENLGYNIVMFDARYHGNSGGNNYTYGYFERWDLKMIVDFLKEKYSDDIFIGLHGESGGAATALLFLRFAKDIKFVVADSSFTDLLTVFKLLEKKYLHTKSEKLLMVINQIIKRRAGFSINDVSPLFEIQALTVPVLFIHSEKDEIVPLKMSKVLQNFKSGYNDIYIGKDSKHLLAYYDHTKEYEDKVSSFVKLIEEKQ